MLKKHSVQFSALALLVYFAAVSCDSSTDPPIDKKPCQDICDTVDLMNPDSSVIISLQALSQEYIVFGLQEYAIFIRESIVVYSLVNNSILLSVPYRNADISGGRLLYCDSWGVKEIDISSNEITPLVQGFTAPSYSSDTSRLLLRRIGESYFYIRATGELIKLTDEDNIREYRDGRFVFYDHGFFVYDTSTGITEPLEISGFPEKMSAVRYPDWDLDLENNTIVVHTPVVDGNLEDNRLYVINLESRTARQVLSRSDWNYTPRFSSTSDLYIVRTCQTSRESYIIKVDPETGCERVVVTAWMNAEGVTEFTKED